MFRWLKRWLLGRKIFEFFDGTKHRRVDPMLIYRKMIAHPEWSFQNEGRDLQIWDSEAWGKTAELIREIFDIPKYDGAVGLTEEELLDLFTSFVVWSQKKRQKIGGLPIFYSNTQERFKALEEITKQSTDSTSTSTTCDSNESETSETESSKESDLRLHQP